MCENEHLQGVYEAWANGQHQYVECLFSQHEFEELGVSPLFMQFERSNLVDDANAVRGGRIRVELQRGDTALTDFREGFVNELEGLGTLTGTLRAEELVSARDIHELDAIWAGIHASRGEFKASVAGKVPRLRRTANFFAETRFAGTS